MGTTVLTPFEITKTIEAAAGDTFFVETNSNITETQDTTVDAYTGVVIQSTISTVTVSTGTVDTVDELYDKLQRETYLTPIEAVGGAGQILSTVDKTNYICRYNVIVNNQVFNGQNRSIDFDTTATMLAYELRVLGDRYQLVPAAGVAPLLGGALRNYTNFSGLIDPYDDPSFPVSPRTATSWCCPTPTERPP